MNTTNYFNNKTLMITGGTGSFGSTVLKHFLDSDLKEIRIFSRDEKKQDDMRHELQAKHPENANKVKFYIGDVRNPQSVRDAMPGVDYIFHAAALKQVPSCEFFPMQAVQTNIIGTDNVLHAAIDAGVESDDGACDICQCPRCCGARRDDHLLHPLRQRYVQPRQRDTAVYRADTFR